MYGKFETPTGIFLLRRTDVVVLEKRSIDLKSVGSWSLGDPCGLLLGLVVARIQCSLGFGPPRGLLLSL